LGLGIGGGGAANGPTNHVFFTAGPAAASMAIFSDGVFGVIEPVPVDIIVSTGKTQNSREDGKTIVAVANTP
jgi:hypothetical protein